MAKKVENKKTGTVRFNKEQGGIELVFPSEVRLGFEETELLKAKGFRWHRKNKYYYARYTEERMTWVRSIFQGIKVSKADEAAVREVAERKAAEAPKREKTKKETTASRLDRLEELMLKVLEGKGVGV